MARTDGTPNSSLDPNFGEPAIPVPRPEEPVESETTQILREAFGYLATYGYDLKVTEQNGQTTIQDPEDEPQTTQP